MFTFVLISLGVTNVKAEDSVTIIFQNTNGQEVASLEVGNAVYTEENLNYFE